VYFGQKKKVISMCTTIASVCTTSLIMAKFSNRGDKDKCYSTLLIFTNFIFKKCTC
jgi:hypothetical protein